jgi:hypothetical protein
MARERFLVCGRMSPKISVILPVYNGEAWLELCLRSVFSQSLADFELLVGDDCSTDGSRGIIARFRGDPRLRVFPCEQNVGLFGNLNRLLENATASIVRFLCQDDMLVVNCLAEEVAYFESHPGVVMAICSARLIDSENRVVDECKTVPSVFVPTLCLQALFYYGCIPGNLSTVSARRAAIERAGGFDESFQMAGDYEMWVRLCQLGNVASIGERLIQLREHPDRLSNVPGAGTKFIEETRRVRSQIMGLLPKQIRPQAVRYSYWRQNVLNAHHFVRCLIAGRFGECRILIRIMGMPDVLVGIALWLLTLNNHLYRPRPVWSNTHPREV